MIPDNITLQYSRQRGTSDEWKVSEVMEFLQKEILSRERTMQLIKSVLYVRGETCTSDTDDNKDNVVSSFASHSVKIKPAKQNNTVLLQTVRACAEGPAGCRSIRCLLDGGSQRRFISENIVRDLKLPVIKQETVTLHTFGSAAPVTAKRNTVKLTLKNVWQKGQKIEIEALETPQVCTAVMKIPESLIITMKQTEKPEEEEALLQFEKTTQYKDGRYKVELPWRPDKSELPDDYRTAKKRFEGLKRQLQSDLVLRHRYNEVVNDYLEQGIEDMAEEDSSPTAVKYYMSHHTVLWEDKISKRLSCKSLLLCDSSGSLHRSMKTEVRSRSPPAHFCSQLHDVEKAFSITANAKQMMSTASMDLCKWTTNSPELKEKWKTTTTEPETETPGAILKVLGLVLRTEMDDFVFDLTALLDAVAKRENTKRRVLKLSARIFDPIVPIASAGMRILHKNGKIIPRWYGVKSEYKHDVQQLHMFCDASKKVYSTVAYLLRETDDGTKTTCLVASTRRPCHVELMGAVIGVRLGNNLLKPLNMKLRQVHLFTDSMIVLQWIRSPAHKWKQFVSNRVSEIQSLTNPAMWSHCKSKVNPADLPTRGQTIMNLKESELWWKGRPFLTTPNLTEESDDDQRDEDLNNELKQVQHISVQLNSSSDQSETEPVLDLLKYSKLKKVLSRRGGELTAEEMFEAEKYWTKAYCNSQTSVTEKNIHGLPNNRDPSIRSPLYVKNDGVLCNAYIALFTCAVTRAVHLELVSSQSTESFLSRRGLCKVIYSDNAKTFKRANQDLSKLWQAIKDPQLLEYFSGKGIRAAWLVRKVLGRASLTFEEISTLLTEVEATLNSRPLTFVHNEVDEPQPLTPAHFLVGERLTALPPKPFPADHDHLTVSKEEMTRRWRYRNRLMTNLWNRWWKDYLLDLKSAHSCSPQKPTELKTGDIVFIGDANMPRQTWKLGKIEQLQILDCVKKTKGYKALASALTSNPSHLIELDLTGNDPGQSGVKELNDLLQDPICQLRTLRFLGPAADEACQYVTGIVGKNPLLLRELNLSKHELGDTRVNQIAALLQDKHCQLNTLT
ncbi:hypothetical protein M9458_057737 [Cirrhinus mrigala]|uniref:DUF5641 domain-containing protein n=1 Tax=Cirrhinus mrigala TaxID=683832 RepID=A0ABD0MAI2_CIRMR